jgi:CRP-like cAMP-binding protein
MGRLERLLFLRSLPAYELLSTEETCAVADRTRERVFPRGAYLHRAGAPIEAVQIIVRGRVEARRRGLPMTVLGARSVVGGLGMLAGDPDGFDCVALEETVTLELPADEAEEVLEDDSGLLLEVARATAEELVRVRGSLGESAGYTSRVVIARRPPERPLDTVARMAALRTTMPFAEGKIDSVAELAREVRELCFAPGQWLFREGDPGGRILLCVSGIVACERIARPQRFRFGAGDAIGAIDSIAGARRWYGARAERDVLVLELEVDRLFDVLADSFDLAMPFVRALSIDLLRVHDARIEEASRAG